MVTLVVKTSIMSSNENE